KNRLSLFEKKIQCRIEKIPLFHYLNMVPIILYAIGAPMSFLWPMWKVHKYMKEYKINRLKELSEQLNDNYEIMQQNILGENTKSCDEIVKKYDNLKKLNDIILTLPTWPFNNKMLKIFAGTWLVPVIPPFVVYIIQYYISKST
ncbi:hypothetical protein ACFL4T_14465, partial [candidate division KSB1 bacterium]